MRRAILALLGAAALVASGCLGGSGPAPTTSPAAKNGFLVDPATYLDKLSKVVFTDILREHVQVPSFDGKKMDNWVFRPKAPEGTKVPVFINFSPYWTNLAPSGEAEGDNFGKYMIHEYVPRGYGVVLSSVRGTGYSEGCFNIGGETERKDAVAVIEHFAKQPWSNGNVGAGGKSYDGTTPQGAAILAPPALKAIFPVSGISELYKYNYKGGLPYGNGATFNEYYYAGVGMDQYTLQPDPNNPTRVPHSPGMDNPFLIADDVACPYLPEMQANGVGSAASGDYTPYWQERNYTKAADKVSAAVFFVHGFTDWNVKPDHILPWLAKLQGPKKVWLHNWTVGNGDGHVYPMRTDWNLTMLRFLDQTLKGIETGIFQEPSYELQDSNGGWHWETAWPPAEPNRTRFLLSSSGATGVLSDKAGTGQRTYEDRPGGTSCANPGTALLYETEALAEELRYTGEPIVHLTVQSTSAAGKVVALLCDGPKMINWGGLNLRHRKALEDPQTITPGTWYEIQFPLFPQDDVVAKGHRLRLVLGASGAQFSAPATGATITVKEDSKAFIEFASLKTIAWQDPQPVPMRCFAC